MRRKTAEENHHVPDHARNRWLLLAQAAWIVASVLALGMFVAGAAIYYGELQQVCTRPAAYCRMFEYATPAEAAQLADEGLSLRSYALSRLAIPVLQLVLPLILSLLIFARKRHEPVALFMAFFLLSFGMANGPTSVLASRMPIFALPVAVHRLAWPIMLAFFFGVFPGGCVVPRIYWIAILFFCSINVADTILPALGSSALLGPPLRWAGWLGIMLGGPAAQIYRYLRVSTPEERRQTKWVLFGLAAMGLWLLGISILEGLFGMELIRTGGASRARLVGLIPLLIMFQFIPLSLGIAILRSRLFDIDVIIRRTLVYSIVSAVVAALYVGGVIVLQQLARPVIDGSSQLAVVGSTLMIAAIFHPLRRRVQSLVDRRFYRRRYDAARTLQAFGMRLRDEVDLSQLTDDLLHVVEETLQLAQVSLWLRGRTSQKP